MVLQNSLNIAPGSLGQVYLGTSTSTVPLFGSTANADFTYTSSTAGSTRTLTVSNTDNTNSSSTAVFQATVGGTSAGNPQTSYTVTGGTTWSTGIHNNATSTNYVISDGVVGTNNRLVLTTVGYMTLPSTCAFGAFVSPTQGTTTGDGTIYQVVSYASVFDRQSNFNTTTGVFTAPISGIYQLSATIAINNIIAAHTLGVFQLITTSNTYNINQSNPNAVRSGAQMVVSGSYSVSMTAGDTAYLTVQVSNGTKIINVVSFTYFSGELLC